MARRVVGAVGVVTGFADFHDELRGVARDVLAKRAPGQPVDWAQMADAGWLGLEVPEALGGAGATFAEVAIVLAEMGRAASLSPYVGTAVLGVGALLAAEASDGRDALLRDVAAGTRVVAVALPSDEHALDASPSFRVDDVGRARGSVDFVLDVVEADALLLVAADDDGPVLAVVDPMHAGLSVEPTPLLDATRQVARLAAAGVTPDAIWRLDDGAPARLVDRAGLAIACDGLGLSEAMLDATVAYVKVREQFGRPIGSFQAVKHACADMLVQVTVGRELLASAVAAVARGDDDATAAVSRASSFLGDAAVAIAGTAMQLHGGIGYTWESGVHVYLKRAALDRSLFGSPRAHRRRLGSRLITSL